MNHTSKIAVLSDLHRGEEDNVFPITNLTNHSSRKSGFIYLSIHHNKTLWLSGIKSKVGGPTIKESNLGEITSASFRSVHFHPPDFLFSISARRASEKGICRV